MSLEDEVDNVIYLVEPQAKDPEPHTNEKQEIIDLAKVRKLRKETRAQQSHLLLQELIDSLSEKSFSELYSTALQKITEQGDIVIAKIWLLSAKKCLERENDKNEEKFEMIRDLMKEIDKILNENPPGLDEKEYQIRALQQKLQNLY